MSQVTDKTSLTAIPGDPYSREEKKKKESRKASSFYSRNQISLGNCYCLTKMLALYKMPWL